MRPENASTNGRNRCISESLTASGLKRYNVPTVTRTGRKVVTTMEHKIDREKFHAIWDTLADLWEEMPTTFGVTLEGLVEADMPMERWTQYLCALTFLDNVGEMMRQTFEPEFVGSAILDALADTVIVADEYEAQ